MLSEAETVVVHCSPFMAWLSLNQVGLLLLGGTEKSTGQRTEVKTSQRGEDPCFMIECSGACRHAPSRSRLKRRGQNLVLHLSLYQIKKQIFLYLLISLVWTSRQLIFFLLLSLSSPLKGIVCPKMNLLTLFTHYHVVIKPFDLLASEEYKMFCELFSL